MIKIIKTLKARSLDLGDGILHTLPMVPATGYLEITEKDDSAGRLATAKISATLSRDHDILRDNLELQVGFCDDEDTVRSFGTVDLPLRLEITMADTIKVSCSYSYPIH